MSKEKTAPSYVCRIYDVTKGDTLAASPFPSMNEPVNIQLNQCVGLADRLACGHVVELQIWDASKDICSTCHNVETKCLCKTRN